MGAVIPHLESTWYVYGDGPADLTHDLINTVTVVVD